MDLLETPAATTADTETPSVTTTPVMKKRMTARQKNQKKKSKMEKEKTKIKTKLSLSLKKKTSKNNELNRKKTSGTKLNAHMHLIPADFVVELVVDFLYDHNLCHCNHCCHPIVMPS